MQTVRSRVAEHQTFETLPLEELQPRKFSIYIIDYAWNYLFANQYAIGLLGTDPTGKNIRDVWKERPEVNFEPLYNLMKESVKKRVPMEVKSRSPLTKRAIEILGQPLKDCYYFSINEVPDKETLMQELKSLLKKRNT